MAGELAGVALTLGDVVRCHTATWIGVEHPKDIPDLETGEVHLYTLDLATLDITLFDRVLDHNDLLRGQRIVDAEKRRLYLGGRFGLKLLLWLYTAISPQMLHFGYGSRGKPMLLSTHAGGPIEFNYTLSRDKVLYAFTRARPLGVDMEVLPRQVNAARMAATRLTLTERSAWLALPGHLKNDGMLCCWTRKEAYGKTLGVGIRFQLGAVNLFSNLDKANWQTPLAAMFETTDSSGMPDYLQGVQLGMPFDAVASLMFASDGSDAPLPSFRAMQLIVNQEILP